MKLAEALILRSDIQKRMEQIKSRIINNVLVQEGENPNEDPDILLEDYYKLQQDLVKLIQAINKTNNQTKFDDKHMLADALTLRDSLLAKRDILIEAAEEASKKQDRYSRSEIKLVSTIDVKKYQKQAAKTSKDYRELDTKIQAMNWTIDLI